jgi:hypothetical protein
VETNIHWPTDSGILWDTYRVLDRYVQAIRKLLPRLLSDKRLHAKRAKRLHSRISRTARHKTTKSRRARKQLYERLIVLVEGILRIPSAVKSYEIRDEPRSPCHLSRRISPHSVSRGRAARRPFAPPPALPLPRPPGPRGPAERTDLGAQGRTPGLRSGTNRPFPCPSVRGGSIPSESVGHGNAFHTNGLRRFSPSRRRA